MAFARPFATARRRQFSGLTHHAQRFFMGGAVRLELFRRRNRL
jgi:hypothetical protein